MWQKNSPLPISRLLGHGFTIVELLIVIVIIAILATITIVAYNGITQQTKISSMKSEVAQWKKKSELYKIEHGIECPVNYSFVYGNATLGTSDFCVMKYEAKNIGGVATSQAPGVPWGGVSQLDAITAATTPCKGCHLTTDAEWMTIAADVLSVKYNWSRGGVGSGFIYSGHNDNVPANALAASSDDDDGYNGTGNSDSSGTNQKRTLYLTSGDVIWDLAGNVHEWTSQSQSMNQVGVPGDTSSTWREYTTAGFSFGNLPAASRPSTLGGIPALSVITSWSSAQGIGQTFTNYSDTSSRAFLRGGYWQNGSTAGVLTFAPVYAPTYSHASFGFRVAK